MHELCVVIDEDRAAPYSPSGHAMLVTIIRVIVPISVGRGADRPEIVAVGWDI